MKKSNNGYITLLNAVVIDTAVASGVVAVTVANPFSGTAYLTIVTASETSASSLNLAITAPLGAGADQTIVTALTTPITTNTTNVYLIGSTATAAGAIVQVFGFPLPKRFTVTFTNTGTTSTFTVTAALAFC